MGIDPLKQRLATLVLFSASLLGAVVLCDLAFRTVEARRLAAGIEVDGPRFDLGAMNYNETVVEAARPAGEFRVLSFGDSFAYSIMTPEHSYAGVISSQLRERGRPVRVVNLGEPASTVTDYRAAYRFWSNRIEHDGALFLIYLGNDLLDVARAYTPRQWLPVRAFRDLDYRIRDGRRRSPVPAKFPIRMLDHFYALYLTATGSEARQVDPPDDPRLNVAAHDNLPHDRFLELNRIQTVNFRWSRIEELRAGYRAVLSFLEFASELAGSGVPVLIALAPNEVQVDRDLRGELFRKFDLQTEELDLTLPARTVLALRDRVDPALQVFDLSPALVCHRDRGRDLYYRTNTHWGPEGNETAGRILADRLAREWFGDPAEPPSAECGSESYYAANARISSDRIRDFVSTLEPAPETAEDEPARPSSSERARPRVDVRCGSLDGMKVDTDGSVFLWGWAFDPRTGQPVEGVRIFDRGRPLPGLAPAEIDRPDVAEFFDDPAMGSSGWNYRVPATEGTAGEGRELTARAWMSDGTECPLALAYESEGSEELPIEATPEPGGS